MTFWVPFCLKSPKHFSPFGRHTCMGCGPKSGDTTTLYRFDSHAGTYIGMISGLKKGASHCLCGFLPAGRVVGVVRMRDEDRCECCQCYNEGRRSFGLAVSADGRWLVVGSRCRCVHLFQYEILIKINVRYHSPFCFLGGLSAVACYNRTGDQCEDDNVIVPVR